MSMNTYLQLLRLNHWFKNLFILAGPMAVILDTGLVPGNLWLFVSKLSLAFLLASLISSANYTINQIADRTFDAKHTEKKHRPIPSGRISISRAYLLALILLVVSLIVARLVFNTWFTWSLIALGIAGLLYNIKPIRFKDVPYIDVISESFNNPLRFLIGWFSLGIPFLPPLVFLLLSWTFGAVFMTAKRYDELVYYGKNLGPYRSTFNVYTPGRLLWLMWLYSGISFLLAVGIWIPLGIILGIFFVWFVHRVTSGQARARDIEGFIFHPLSNRK